MAPNVYGMGLFSDGGIFATKPYICASSYLLKMSDFKRGDSNILNYMLKNNRIYIIDFGMSKPIDDKFKKKIKEERPNFTLMNLGFILKLKDLKCPSTAYKYLINFVSEENKRKYGI